MGWKDKRGLWFTDQCGEKTRGDLWFTDQCGEKIEGACELRTSVVKRQEELLVYGPVLWKDKKRLVLNTDGWCLWQKGRKTTDYCTHLVFSQYKQWCLQAGEARWAATILTESTTPARDLAKSFKERNSGHRLADFHGNLKCTAAGKHA